MQTSVAARARFDHALADLGERQQIRACPRNASLVLPLEKAQNWHLNETDVGIVDVRVINRSRCRRPRRAAVHPLPMQIAEKSSSRARKSYDFSLV